MLRSQSVNPQQHERTPHMPTPVIMPKFEMTQETGKVLAWLKNEGELIEKGEPLLEVETDKVNQEVEAPASGILAGISARPGQVVPIATPIAYILKPGETLAADATAPPAVSNRRRAALRPPAPDRHSSEPPQRMQGHARWRSGWPRATASISNQVAGTGPLRTHHRKKMSRRPSRPRRLATAAASRWTAKVAAVPAARRLARELGVDLRTVPRHRPRGTHPVEGCRAGRSPLRRLTRRRGPGRADSSPAPQLTAPALAAVGSAVRRSRPADQHPPHHCGTHDRQRARGAAVHGQRRCGHGPGARHRRGPKSRPPAERQAEGDADGAAGQGVRLGAAPASRGQRVVPARSTARDRRVGRGERRRGDRHRRRG